MIELSYNGFLSSSLIVNQSGFLSF